MGFYVCSCGYETDSFENYLYHRCGKFIESGATQMNGAIPVNPSGGVLSSNVAMANGLIRVAEIAEQLMGKAEKRQIPDAKIGLAYGMNGICSQGNCVLIFGGER